MIKNKSFLLVFHDSKTRMEKEIFDIPPNLIDLDFEDLRCLFAKTIRDKNFQKLNEIIEIIGEKGYKPLADFLSYQIYDCLNEDLKYLRKWLETIFQAINVNRNFYICLLIDVIGSGTDDKTPFLMDMLKNDYQLLFDALMEMKDEDVFDSCKFYDAARSVRNNLTLPRLEDKIQEELSRKNHSNHSNHSNKNMSCGRLLLYGATFEEEKLWRKKLRISKPLTKFEVELQNRYPGFRFN